MTDPWEAGLKPAQQPAAAPPPATEAPAATPGVVGGAGGADPWEASLVPFDRSRFDLKKESGFDAPGPQRNNLSTALKGKAAGMKDAEERQKKGLPSKPISKLQSAGLGLSQGVTLGWGDEALAAGKAGYDWLTGDTKPDEGFGGRYEKLHHGYNQQLEQARNENPWTYGLSNFAGGVASGLVAPVLRGGSLLATGAKTGALYGGITGAGEGEGLEGSLKGAVTGAGTGAVVGGALGKVGDVIGARKQAKAIDRAAEEIRLGLPQTQADEFGINLTRAQRSRDNNHYSQEERWRNDNSNPDAVAAGQRQRVRQGDQVEGAIDDMANELGGGIDPTTGRPFVLHDHPVKAGADLQQRIATGVQDRENAANTARQQLEDIIVNRPNAPPVNDYDVGSQVATRLRSEAEQGRQGYRSAYDDAYSREGTVDRRAVEGLHSRVQEDLTYGHNPVEITEYTPNARRALQILEDTSNFRGPNNRAAPGGMPDPASVTGVNWRGMESVRKRLVQLAQQSASNPTDQRAVRSVIERFDQHLEDVIHNGLFQGDDGVLDALRNARRLYSEHRARFNPTGDIATDMRKIIQQDANPEHIANFLYGSSQLGSRSQSAHLASHIRDVLGAQSPEWNAVRQGAWRRLTGAEENITHENAAEIAERIRQFTTNRGRSLAQQMFSPAEIRNMQLLQGFLHNMATTTRNGASPEAVREIVKIARGNYNPEAVINMAVGNPKSPQNWRVVDAVQQVFGRDSQEFSNLRQAAFRHMLENAPGNNQKGYTLMATRLREFADGQGQTVANTLYKPEELAKMRRLASLLDRLPTPGDATQPSKTAYKNVENLKMVTRTLIRTLGFSQGSVPGWIMADLGVDASEKVINKFGARQAEAAFNGRPVPPTLRETAYDGAGTATQKIAGTGRKLSGPLAPNAASGRAAAGDDTGDDESPPLQITVKPKGGALSQTR